jgi:hypothetical protein
MLKTSVPSSVDAVELPLPRAPGPHGPIPSSEHCQKSHTPPKCTSCSQERDERVDRCLDCTENWVHDSLPQDVPSEGWTWEWGLSPWSSRWAPPSTTCTQTCPGKNAPRIPKTLPSLSLQE